MKDMATTRTVVAKASVTVLTATSIREKSRSKRLPNFSINVGADKKSRILPKAPTRKRKLTVSGPKNCFKREKKTGDKNWRKSLHAPRITGMTVGFLAVRWKRNRETSSVTAFLV